MKPFALHVFALMIIAHVPISASAQNSCPFVTHVNGTMGKDTVTCGTENLPCATIQYGINRAKINADTLVRISAGNYNEIIELEGGISLWGGFDNSWKFSGTTTIAGAKAGNGEYYTLHAQNITKTTFISDITIVGPNASEAGKSSYAMHISNSSGLVLQRLIIKGGIAADGSNGIDGSNATVAGVDGARGGDAMEYSTSCDNTNSGAGGAGGYISGYPYANGGSGGRGGYMDADCSFSNLNLNATAGINGNYAAQFVFNGAGTGGPGSAPCSSAGNGKPGLTVHGNGGSGASLAQNMNGNFWAAITANAGSLGKNGTGGGGGGGAGGCDNGTDAYGAGGGGGGSGGIASADAGTGGGSGGNSAAIFIYNSSCKILNSQVIGGSAGNGGNGGKSGMGTKGGKGGNGGLGVGINDGGPAGKGGDGGDGGNSGGGGGGAGGSSYGIYGTSAVIYRSGVTIEGGTAGKSGAGGAGFIDSVSGKNGDSGIAVLIGGSIKDSVVTLNVVQDPCSVYLKVKTYSPEKIISVFPNPSPDGTIMILNRYTLNASVTIYDMTGKLLLNKDIRAHSTHSITIPGHGLFYISSRFSDGSLQTEKVWIE